MLLMTPVLEAQNTSVSLWEENIEQLSMDEEENNWEDELEELSNRLREPVNINVTTKRELEQFPFLSDIQIENILAYVYIHGQMQTIYELQLVEEMDKHTIDLLLPFVCVHPVAEKKGFPRLKSLLKYGKQEVLTRLDVPFYTRKGYQKNYLGPAMYHSLRYGYRYGDYLQMGITAEKDAGEPFFALHNEKGYDYYSIYFLLRNLGKLKTLALGNYRLSFGQGLVVSTDFRLGKTYSLSTVDNRNSGIRKHSSTDEYNYFRGAAATVEVIPALQLSGFYSHRSMDGVIEGNEITSIYKTGLHRTEKEADKVNAFTLQLMGGNITYEKNNLKVGMTGIYYFFNRSYQPELRTYAKYNLQGNYFHNVGVDYKYRWNKLSFVGEAAICQSGRVAILNILRFTPFSGYQLVMLQRYYDKGYAAWFARSISEGSDIRNENGFYMGVEANPIKYWKLSAYADFFHFPWLRYGVDKPSSGFDGLVQATYTPKRNMTMFLRYQYKVKDQNYIGEKKITCPYVKHKLRYQLGYTLQKFFSLRTTVDFVIIHPENVSSSHGFMLSQMFSYSFQQLPLQLSVNYGFFDTDNYESRLTTYEKGMLYSLSLPSFYGKGIRTSLHVRYDFNKYLTALVKISQSKYMDRDEIGTGLEMIAGNKKSDMNMQIRYKF